MRIERQFRRYDDTYSSVYVNLAEERFGTSVLWATDDFFAEKENLIKPGRGQYDPERYTDRGKWMDGWETRRRRDTNHDYCIVRLGMSGIIYGLDIDTNHFAGNHPSHASVEACHVIGDPTDETEWTEILPKSEVRSSNQNLFEVESRQPWTHVRLHIYPDGGVARFRVYGEVEFDWSRHNKETRIDLVAVKHGGRVVQCSDMFFSSARNLLFPGRGQAMWDGWETKRRRGPGYDWVILKLARQGLIRRIEVDTANFKGNYPDRCSFDAIDWTGKDQKDLEPDNPGWKPMLAETPLTADNQHFYEMELADVGPVTHVKFNIFPDGGVSRVRLLGYIV